MKRNAVAWAALVVSVAALAGSRFSAKPVQAVQDIPADGQKAARALSDAFGAVADYARPSVVQISVQKEAEGNRGRTRMAQGTGSGFVYDDKGDILTNNHVVDDAGTITVTFHDGETLPAKVVGTDPDADVAVIRVDTTAYRPLPTGQSAKLRVGEWVMAIGSPFGLDQTVTAGIISATERGTVGINKYESFLQTDCAINPGNSGGPLVDMNGRVVGINSAIATNTRSSAGVGFAIPIDMARVLADKLIKDGKVSRARVGLILDPEPITPSVAKRLGLKAKTHGVLVASVAEGGPGEKSGLRKGDLIYEFDGHPINTMSNFRNLVSASDAGKSYGMKFFREGKPSEVQVTPALEKDVKFAFERTIAIRDLGIALTAVSADEASLLGYPEGEAGLLVDIVAEDGPAGRAGISKGDLIVGAVKGRKVVTVETVEDLVAVAVGQDGLVVSVRAAGEPNAEPKLRKLVP